MKWGADTKKLAILGGLVVVGGYLFYSNVLSGPSSPEPARPTHAIAHTSPPPPVVPLAASQTAQRRQMTASRAEEEFRPSLKPKRPEDRVDPATIDPTLRTDLLAKVQAVTMEGTSRNLFQYGAPPAPPLPPEPKVKPKTPQQVAEEQIQKQKEAGPPPPPPPPPINLKYYGYSSPRGADAAKRAFFLDGDEILVAAEGEMVKKRYRVVRIGVNSVVMEDTQFKHEQTLPLAEEAAG